MPGSSKISSKRLLCAGGATIEVGGAGGGTDGGWDAGIDGGELKISSNCSLCAGATSVGGGGGFCLGAIHILRNHL